MKINKGVFLCGLALLCLPAFAHAAATHLKIISAPQSILISATSSVFTIESQDDNATLSPVSITTHASLVSSSATGLFLSASASACNSATTSSVTISTNTSHKSFCYIDPSPGSFTISISVPDQPAILGDSQIIVVGGAVSPTPPSPSPSPEPSPSSGPDSASSTPDNSGSGSQGQNNPQNQTSGGSGGGLSPEAFTKSGNVIISEFLPNPAGEDSGHEQVELLNNGTAPVSLDGWLLDDQSAAGPKAGAYKLSGFINPNQFLVITIPKGSFALNNSGGDTLNLYYPDKTLADSVSYTDAAAENISYQKVGDTWVWAPPTFGQANAEIDLPQQGQSYAISISEIMPNPVGQDEGKEWVELYNTNNFAVSLSGFILDDSGTGVPGSDSLALSESQIIPALGYLQVILPEGSFSLDNSGDSVRLFGPDNNLLETESYTNAPEGQSYFKGKDGAWEFGAPTPGQPNFIDAPLFNLFISEILPNPGQDEDEFVEIYNSASTTVNLQNFVLQVGSKQKVFDDTSEIGPQSYFAVYDDDLPGRLRNSGQTVTLTDLYGRQVSQVTYDKAEQGLSYASNDGKSYAWTESVTPAAPNQFVLGAQISADAQSPAKSSASAKASSADSITKAEGKEILQSNEDLKQQIAVLQESVNALQEKLDSQNSSSQPQSQVQPDQTNTNKKPVAQMLVLPAALAAMGGIMVVAFKKLKK